MENDQIGEKLSLIARQVQHLNSIVEDVLSLGHIQSGRIEFHPREIDLDQLCQEVITVFRNRPDIPHQIHYTPQASAVIFTLDRTLISQVIINLLTNAISLHRRVKIFGSRSNRRHYACAIELSASRHRTSTTYLNPFTAPITWVRFLARDWGLLSPRKLSSGTVAHSPLKARSASAARSVYDLVQINWVLLTFAHPHPPPPL